MLRQLIMCMALVLASAGAITAQTNTIVRSPILTVDRDRLYQASAFGQRVAQELEARGALLSSENRQIELELEQEEKVLTQQRETLSAEEFRDLADAFDAKVTQTRQAQSAKNLELNQELDQQQLIFLQAAGSVLEELMREAGAVVVLDRRDVFLSLDAIDITTAAILRIDASLGAGAPLPATGD